MSDQKSRLTPGAIRFGYPFRIAIAAAALAISWFAFGSTWGALVAARPESELILDENFPNGAATRGARVEPSGFFACPDGWCVTQTTDGTLIYRPPPRRTGILSRISPWFYMPSAGTNEIAISLDDGRTFVPLAANTAYSGAGFSVPEHLQQAGASIALRFTVHNRGPNQALGLDKLLLVYTTGPAPELAPRTSVMFAFFVAGLGLVAGIRRPGRGLAVLLILTVAAGLRYDAFAHAVDRPLDPDARGYRYLAARMDLFSNDNGFYSANFGVREPGFMFAVHEFFMATHDSDYHLRLLTVSLSVALVLVAMVVAFALFGTAGGLFAGIMLALNVPLVGESVRGLRLEAETILWLVWLAVVFVWRRASTVRDFAVIGLLAGMVLLVRWTYVPPLVVLIVLAAWIGAPRGRARVACAAMAVAVMIAVVTPHRIAMYHRLGDGFLDTKMYARWLANFEFADRPGFPTRVSLELNGYLGPPITYGQYLFGLHTPRELIDGTLRGYYKMLSNMNAPLEEIPFVGKPIPTLSAAVLILGLAGMVAAMFRRRYLWLPVAFATVLAPAAFLYDRGLLEEYRHSYQAFPLLLLSACVPFALMAELRSRSRRSGQPAEVGADS